MRYYGGYHFKLCIDHFHFRAHREGDQTLCHDWTDSVECLERYDRAEEHLYPCLALSDLSLDYDPSMELTLVEELMVHKLWAFDTASSGFLSTFISSAIFSTYGETELEFFSFLRCTIPFVDITPYCFGNLTTESVNMDYRTSTDSSLSIHNAVQIYPGSHMRMLRCEHVSDELFQYLSALRSFIAERRGAVRALRYVLVSGKGPALTQSDGE